MSRKNGKAARCRIPQKDFLSGSTYIVTVYDNDAIVEAYDFKYDAREGARSLGHDKFVDMIQGQMDILCEAIEINENKEGEG